LTKNTQVAGAVCDSDVRRLIIDEATDVTSQLPMGSCEGPTLIPKSWTQLNDSTIQCTMPPGTIDDESEDGDEDGGATEDSDEDSAAASDEEPGEGQASDEGDSIEASGEEEEEASGDGEEFDDEEGSSDGGEASNEGDSNEASEEEEEEEEEGSSDGEEASDEGETEEEEDSNDEGEENIFDNEDEEDSEDEVESEEEEFDESEEEPFSLVRGSNLGNSQSCHLTCMNSFNICQSSITAKCETYFEACKSECHEAEAIGEIAEDELSTCLDEWCMDDKDICYSEAETRCQRRRTNCLRKC